MCCSDFYLEQHFFFIIVLYKKAPINPKLSSTPYDRNKNYSAVCVSNFGEKIKWGNGVKEVFPLFKTIWYSPKILVSTSIDNFSCFDIVNEKRPYFTTLILMSCHFQVSTAFSTSFARYSIMQLPLIFRRARPRSPYMLTDGRCASATFPFYPSAPG